MESRCRLGSEQSACTSPAAPVGTRHRLCKVRLRSEMRASLSCRVPPQALTVRGYVVNGFQERFIITSAPNICGQHGPLAGSPGSPQQSGSLFYTDFTDPEVLQPRGGWPFQVLRLTHVGEMVPEIPGGAPHLPTSHISGWGQSRVRVERGGLRCSARQCRAGPSPGPVQLLTLVGHYLAPNLPGAEPRPGSGRMFSSCSRAPQTGLGDH